MKEKVFVGLSGGVDSSVSAALLKEAGFDVTGVFIKTWNPEWLKCDWKEDRRDAMRIAVELDIPFITIDLEKEYKEAVADYMIEEYKKGRTPNPDVMCNKHVKFGSFLDKALDMGAQYIATGHYAQNIDNKLALSADKEKDQTYFLWTLTNNQLKHIKFPVGKYTKEEVRKLAKKFNLPTAQKKDSQGVCFLGKFDIKDFLSHYVEASEGNVLNEEGNVIGRHDGAIFYTIGQRHGFVIKDKGIKDSRMYVILKDLDNNTITVASEKKEGEKPFETTEAKLGSLNWIESKPEGKVKSRIRHRQSPQDCIITGDRVKFEEPQSLAVGQSVVFYNSKYCLGGGIIEEVL